MGDQSSRKLPENANLVFKGKIFDVYQWEQKMYDGTTETFERLKRPDTVVVVPTVGDKVLVLDQEQPDKPEPFVDFPAGRADRIDGGSAHSPQDILSEAKRELLEETGYTSDDWQLIGSNEPHGKIAWTVYVYVARNCRKVAEPKPDAGEKLSPRLISFDEMIMLSDDPRFRGGKQTEEFLRMRLDPAKREAFRKLLFPEK